MNIQSDTMYKDCPNYFITNILKQYAKLLSQEHQTNNYNK